MFVYNYKYHAQEKELGWFGRRTHAHANEYYTRYFFSAGKFISFEGCGRSRMRHALQQQARYLYGPGEPTKDGFRWAGRQVEAWIASDDQSPTTTLLVESTAFARQQAQADRLKQENAQGVG